MREKIREFNKGLGENFLTCLCETLRYLFINEPEKHGLMKDVVYKYFGIKNLADIKITNRNTFVENMEVILGKIRFDQTKFKVIKKEESFLIDPEFIFPEIEKEKETKKEFTAKRRRDATYCFSQS
jgi:hypothetical protein